MPTLEEYRKFKEAYDKHGYYGFVKPEEENKIKIQDAKPTGKPSIIDETVNTMMSQENFDRVRKNVETNGLRATETPSLMPYVEAAAALTSPLLDGASFFVKPILEKKYAPDFYEMQQQAKAKHPYLSAVGNVGGYLLPGTLIAKGVKAGATALKSIPFISNFASKALPGTDMVGKAANLGLYAGAEGVGLGAMEGTAEGIKEGYSATDTLKNALSKAKEYGETGLILGPALTGLGLLGKNQLTRNAVNKNLNQIDDAYNTMAKGGIASLPKVNTNIADTIPFGTLSSQLQMQAEKIAPKIDAYTARFPQINEPKITSDVPLRYKPSPKIEEPLMLNAPKGTYLKQQAGEGKSFTMRPIETTGTVKEYKFQRNPVSKKEVLPETNENLSDWSIDDIADENEFWKSFGSDNIASKSSKFVKGIDDRNFENVGDRIVKSIQHERPELKSFIQQEASRLLQELKGSIKGKRYPVFEEDGYIREYVGDKRFTSESIERILDNLPNKPTYQEIEDAIQKIIRDGGAENNALSKRIELIIDDNLSKGTNSIDQIPLPPNKLYNALKTGEVSDAIPKNVNILRRVQNEKEITKNVIPSIKEKLQNINNSRNPYYVQPEFRKEIAGDPTRPIKLPPVVNATKNEVVKSIVSPQKVNGNMKSPSTNKNATEAIVEPNRPIQANEILKNKEIDTNVVPIKKSQQYSSEIQEKLDAANAKYKLDSQRIKENKIMDAVQKSKRLKGLGEQHSANKRNIIQGDSLIPVEGGLTSKELNAKISKLKSNYAGKEVFTPDGEGIVTGQSSFGKVGVKIDGIVKYYPKEKIQPKVDVDEIIKQQKESQSQVFNTSNNVPGKMEAAEPIIETPIPKQPKTQTAQTPPNVNNAIPDNPILKESEVKTNTMRNRIEELQTPKGQKFVDDFDAVYQVKPNDKTIQKANSMLENDFDNTLNRIMKNGVENPEDNLAGWAMIKALAKQKRYSEADILASKIQPEITNVAQILQSMKAIPKNSLEGKVLWAKKFMASLETDLKATNPEKYQEAMKSVGLVNDAINKNLKLLDINLQLFADTVDKELKQIMGKLYKKDYISSIMKVIDDNRNLKAPVGGQVQMAGIKNELSPEMMQKISDAVKTKYGLSSFGADDIAKISKLYDELDNIPKDTWEYRAQMDKIDNVVRSKIPKEVSDKLAAYQFINLYGNTRTPMKIWGGNITSVTQTHIKDMLKYAIDRGLNVVLPGKATTQMPSLKTKKDSVIKGVKETWKDYRNEVDTDIFNQSYDIDMRHGLTFQKKFMREAEKLTKFMMAVMERPWKQSIYDDELRMMMKSANVSEPTQEMIDAAIEKGNSVMFANRTIATKAAENVRRGVNKVSNTLFNKIPGVNIKNVEKFGVGNLVQPVIKTPINMLTTALEYSPLSPIASFKNGKFNRELFVDNMAKAIIGSVFGMSAGYAGKKAGVISGGLPSDVDARKFGEEAGRQPYAINLGGKSIDVSYIQPLGMLMSFGAELASDNKKKRPIIAAVDSLLNQGMLQGFAKLLGQSSTYSSQKGLSENAFDAVTSGANTLLPFSSLQNQISKSIDTYKRETGDDNVFYKNIVNRVQARTPLRLLMPPKINTTGEKLKEDSILNTWLFPGNIKNIKQDETTKELMRLYDEGAETMQFPPKAGGKITYKEYQGGKSKAKELTPQEQAVFQEMLGKANMEAIKEAMNTPEYMLGNDEQKAKKISDAMAAAKQKIETEYLMGNNIYEYVSQPASSGGRTRSRSRSRSR